MDDSDDGFAANNRACLQAGLAWLRACLMPRIAQPQPAPAVRQGWGFRSRSKVPALPLLLPETAGLAFEESLNSDPPPALAVLAQRFRLSAFERNMLLLTAAVELDVDMPALIAAANREPLLRAPTFALGMSLFDEPAWDALAPERPLRCWELIEIHQTGAASLLAAALRIDERIAAYIKGLNYLDERIAMVSRPLPASALLPPSQQPAAHGLTQYLNAGMPGAVQLLGMDPASKTDVAASAARAAGRALLGVAADDLPSRPEEFERFARLWAREAMLLPLVLLVEGVESESAAMRDEIIPTVQRLSPRLLRRLHTATLLDTRHAIRELDDVPALAVAPPLPTERLSLWRDALGTDESRQPALMRLADEFKLSASRIARLAASGLDGDAGRAWDVCLNHTAAALDAIALRVSSRATIADLKLPPHDKAQVERLIVHARQRNRVLSDYGFRDGGGRGLGLAALFHGESGVGKTMAAEAVANALSLALFRVDLSAVVSKYIGETSKNLRRVFDQAESGGAVLLFDEADAVFGRRSEIKDSHDRYANIDVDYLLTRMEAFDGVTILATNMKHALDPAFVRRLRFVVGFPFPGLQERKEIWRTVFPDPQRVGQLDVERLARFALTGGSIFNAALAAAHSAAAADSAIEMEHVLDAIRWELRKMGRPLAEQEFALGSREAA
jgi:hypothetical protein